MNRKNLKLLADYLMTLPEDYQHFDMLDFNTTAKDYPIAAVPYTCGTAGCAIGHAPYVEGLPTPEDDEYWEDYCTRVLGIDDMEDSQTWDWCFSVSWFETDNTPHGAAKRIYWLLEHGLPADWQEQMHRRAKLCYKEKGE